MCSELLVHEDSYKHRTLVSSSHRSRLRTILRVFCRYVPTACGTWADYGCSNGFIAQTIVEQNRYHFEKIVGYDHSAELIELARQKNIAHAEFNYLDLNEPNDVGTRFDVVTCFETLEHAGDSETAFANLFAGLKTGGTLIITVPNETGMVGLMKFVGRLVAREDAYRDFFSNRSRAKYIGHLLKSEYIDGFRDPALTGYGPHLGFDYRRLREHIYECYVRKGKLEVVDEFYAVFWMSVVMVFRKTG